MLRCLAGLDAHRGGETSRLGRALEASLRTAAVPTAAEPAPQGAAGKGGKGGKGRKSPAEALAQRLREATAGPDGTEVSTMLEALTSLEACIASCRREVEARPPDPVDVPMPDAAPAAHYDAHLLGRILREVPGSTPASARSALIAAGNLFHPAKRHLLSETILAAESWCV